MNSPSCDEKAKRGFVVHNTFLELHSKTALQHSPKQAEVDGDWKKTKKQKKNKHEKAPNSSSSVILISDSP